MTSSPSNVFEDRLWEDRVRPFQEQLPVNIVKMVESFGLRVWERNMDRDVSGMIMRDTRHGGRAQYSIIVPKQDSLPRKRFAVAHEFAHFLLHKHFIGDELSDSVLFLSRLNSLQEVQANKLALDLLMPLSQVEKEIRRGATSIEELASRFEVTAQMASMRLGVPA